MRPCRTELLAASRAKVGLVLACVLVAGPAWAASGAVGLLKEMPAKGSVRQGDVVYVDDGRCPAGEVRKITGGNQMTGVARKVECVKRPPAGAQPQPQPQP